MCKTVLVNRRAIDVCVPVLHEQKVGAFKSKVVPLDADEYRVLQSLVDLLQPASAVTVQLSGEKYVTSSYGVPMINALLVRTAALVPSISNVEVKAVGERLISEIKERFNTGSPAQLLCHLLDPRFKNPKVDVATQGTYMVELGTEFSNEQVLYEADKAAAAAASALASVPVPKPAVVQVAGPPVEKKKSATSSVLEDLRDLFGMGVAEPVPAPPADDELTEYLAREAVLDLDKDPLTWWRERTDKYPILSRMARKHLCMQATSVPCERVWSTAGNALTAQRMGLSPKNLESLVLIHENYRRLRALLKTA
jgi:hypothetical protein